MGLPELYTYASPHIWKYCSALVFVIFLKYDEPVEGRYCDVFTSRFPGASTGNFFEMMRLGTIVVGNKDGASVGNGDLLWKRTASSLCPGEARHGVTSLED